MNTITTTNQNEKQQQQRQLPSDMINYITTYIPKPSYKDYEKYILLFEELDNKIDDFSSKCHDNYHHSEDCYCFIGEMYETFEIYYNDEFVKQPFIAEFESIFSLMKKNEFHGEEFIIRMFFDNKTLDRIHHVSSMFWDMNQYFQEDDNIINIMISYVIFTREFSLNDNMICNNDYYIIIKEQKEYKISYYATIEDYTDYKKIKNAFELDNSLYNPEIYTKKRQPILEIKIRNIKNKYKI